MDENVWMCRAWITEKSSEKPIFQRGTVILDSGASTTVTGTAWMREWEKSYGYNLRKSTRAFRFGPGEPVKSIGQTTIFADIAVIKEDQSVGRIQCAIDVEIVPREVPFLVSRSSLCRMSAMIDFENDTLISKERGSLKLDINDANHYVVRLTPSIATDEHARNIWLAQERDSKKITPVEGVGGVIPPLRNSVEGRTDVIPPVAVAVTKDEVSVEGVGAIIHPRNMSSVEGRGKVIPPVAIAVTKDEVPVEGLGK